MHCPRCGQQQIADQTKFCSRCGFQLGLVAEILEHGGFLPQLAELTKGKAPFLNKKNGVTFGIIWFIFFVMMMPAFFGIAGEDEAAGVSAVFGVFTTMMIVVASLAFLPSSKRGYATTPELPASNPAALYGHNAMGALPPQQTRPASEYAAPQGGWRTPDTGELARPGSVTEGTTKLLKNEEE
jgi:hypothetical protein